MTMNTLDEINSLTKDYYDSLKEGKGLKHLMRWNTDSLDSLDSLLDSLKEKGPALNLPAITPEEDELTALMNRKLEERRALERSGKKKIKW